MLSLILIVPGLVIGYALLARPLLRRIPALKPFYDNADGFWAKVWAACGQSLTVLWGYVLGGIAAAFGLVDQLGAALGDPSLILKQQVIDALKDNPSLLGYAITGISVVTILARLRSLGK